ncbi:hypothetical protein HME9302_02566 [Alteripontixanthobacter maritimus]|uniref:Zinc finger/thioredoxin putative domain-containing protein n=1 Tax=Alteripontixanthobacter maritimus TaxID=2161824 RepID=A0A369Q1W8_9SPHN|nr:zinc-ribbon domain-containing protein [Alteripontixanthobacter maritimus]RDC58893.1 hypothetical protein HME9302_00068 [Alteripontixanthobacter maritimus]RDC61345.1 hypothetical protein HME9302_02566 [Alteripontixanthobacter maritimus]
MIIACPACTTRYVVPDDAVGVEGRTVRCAKCKHSWFQDGPELELRNEVGEHAARSDPATPPADQVTPPVPVDEAPASVSSVPAAPVRSQPAQAEPAVAAEPERNPEPPPAPVSQPSVVERASPAVSTERDDIDYGSQFDHAPPFRGRRNPLKIWTAAAAMFAALALGVVAAVSYWGLPEWVPVSRPTFAMEEPDLVLEFPPGQQDRRTLPNGTEFFGASGTVTNVGRTTQNVPAILIVLRDARDRIVYSWKVVPTKSRLAPGESLTVNEAVTDVPKSAKFAEIGWSPS